MRKILTGIVCGLLSVMSALTLAADKSKPFPAVVRHMEQSGAQIQESYPAAKDLTAWVVEKDGMRQLFYSTPNGTLVAGRLFGDNGEDLSALDRQRIGTGQPGGEYSQVWKALQSVRYGTPHTQKIVSPKRVVYIMFDPMCPHCRQLWRNTRNANFSPDAELRWVPVAKIRKESSILAQVMLDATDIPGREKAMVGIASPLIKVRPEIAKEIEANGAIFDQIGVNNVPVMLYQDYGGAVRAIVGPEIDVVMAAMSRK